MRPRHVIRARRARFIRSCVSALRAVGACIVVVLAVLPTLARAEPVCTMTAQLPGGATSTVSSQELDFRLNFLELQVPAGPVVLSMSCVNIPGYSVRWYDVTSLQPSPSTPLDSRCLSSLEAQLPRIGTGSAVSVSPGSPVGMYLGVAYAPSGECEVGLVAVLAPSAGLNVVATVPVASSPDSMALAPDARTGIVLNQFPDAQGANFRVLDLQTRAVTRALRVGTRLASSVVVGSTALAVDDAENTIHVVGVANGVQSPPIAVGARPSDVAIVDNDRVAVTSGANGDLSLVRLSAASVEQRVRVGVEPRAVAPHPRGRYLYVALGGESSIAVVDAGVSPALVVGTLAVGRNPGSVAFSASGARAVVTNQDGNTITVLDASNPAQPIVVRTVQTGVQPVRAAFDPRNANTIYVVHKVSRFVTIVDTSRIPGAGASAFSSKVVDAAVVGVVNTPNPSSDVQFMLGQVMMLVLEYANDARVLYVDPTNIGQITPMPDIDPKLSVSILPISRAMPVNGAATAFATVINAGPTTAQGCRIGLPNTIPATLTYQTTSAQTNAPTGAPDTPAAIAPGAAQTFVFSIRPTIAFPQTDIALEFQCTSSEFATPAAGINTFLLTSSSQPTPDIVALAATPTNDGIVRVEGATPAAFAVATVNVGVAGAVVASVDGRGDAANGVTLSICRTGTNGACLQPPTSSVTTGFAANETGTFSVFVSGTGAPVPLDPNSTRIFVRFESPGGASFGATSVAVQVR